MKNREVLISDFIKKIQLYCEKCNRYYETFVNGERKVIKNCRTCDSQLKAQCPKCKNVYMTYKCAVKHLSSVCDPQDIFYCNDCLYETKDKIDIKYHVLRLHLQVDPEHYVKCDKCDKHFKSDVLMRKHKSKCNRNYTCDYCKYAYRNKFDLRLHIENVHENPLANFTCDYCSYKSRYQRILQRHMNDKHSQLMTGLGKDNYARIKRFEFNEGSKLFNLIKMYCRNCEKTYDPKINGTRRLLSKCTECQTILHGQCPKCNNIYTSYRSTKEHIKSVCDPQTIYKCLDCHFETSSKVKLKNHLEQKHLIVQSENYVNCKKCEKSFKTMRILKKHLLKCGMRKSLVCHFCNGIFHDKFKLKNHIKIIHLNNNVDKYRCDLCTFEAIHKQYLTKHVKNKHSEYYKTLMARTGQSNNGNSRTSSLNNPISEITSRVSEITMHCENCSKVYKHHQRNENTMVKVCKKCNRQLKAKCPKCNNLYKTYKSAKDHLKYVCAPRFVFSCHHCNFGTTKKSLLKFHVQRIHLKELVKRHNVTDKNISV